ncbi:death domain-containing protein 1 [Stegastes partitus]|uniref:Death domain-containing protein 1 n=1 Tax=Stegastes partitus TaxID=144197 RepID=A0A9Y4MU27_9TELE|nr:PREDICTED: death domain-containing protein 1 [Stegastes partitus]
MLGPAEEEREGERSERERKVLRLLRDLSGFHSDGLTAWREAMRERPFSVNKSPPGGGDRQSEAGMENSDIEPCLDSFSDVLLSVGEDVENILDKLSAIITKLDAAVLHLSVDEASTVDPALREPGETREQPEDNQVNGHERLEQEVEDGGDQSRTRSLQDTEQIQESSWSHNDVEKTEDEIQVRGQVSDSEDVVAEKDQEKKTDEMKGEWITVGLCGQLEGRSDVPCFIRAPAGDATSLRCEAADDLSCLMVSGSEELVSRVIRVKARDGAACRFPVAVAVPFHARYRGGYRDVAVKIVDEERRVSYITPVTTEGLYGGQRGSFAEVKVYSLGLFAVVSCLKRENYTVLRRGLSLKLPMDPRICLNYLPGSFTAPVMAQTMIQPLDAVLLASVKSRNDAYRAVVSTSPVLYLTHPTSQPLRRPLTVTLPCPPNPDKKKDTRGQTEEHQPVTASPVWDHLATPRMRILGASVKSKEMSNESLVVLGSRDKQWNVLDDVIVRNQQNGLVSFDLTENFDRLLVVRLISPLQPCHLASLAEQLEESVCCHAVTVVLQRREDEPHAVLVAALPSRDLGWELNRLRARGCRGFTETSPEISMCEADQLLLRFSGNITSTVSDNKNEERITFHSQRKNQLLVRLTEVDPFGNYSSPHYKGTAIFYKVTKGQLEWRGDEAVLKETKLLGEPVCKLSLTLPKKVRNNRPIAPRLKPCEETDSLPDSLLLWLSGELSEEELSLLALSLRLRRSTAQLVKLRAGDSPSSRAFRILATWRRGLPAVPHQPKTSQLARCLAKSGRPDLARELLLRQAAATRQGSV